MKIGEWLTTALVIIIIVFSIFRGLLVPESRAVKALEIQGFSKIEVVDRAWFAIGLRGGEKSDAARFKVKALNPTGKTVVVYVFVGWPLKGATIRSL